MMLGTPSLDSCQTHGPRETIVDEVEYLLRAARFSPPATSTGLDEVRRRGRRRHVGVLAATASSGLAVVALGALAFANMAGSPSRSVLLADTPSAAPTTSSVSAPPAPALRVVEKIGWASGTISADGNAITVTYIARSPEGGKGACAQTVRARAEETADTVTVTLEVVAPVDAPAPTAVCPARRYERTATATVRSSIGQRRVVDGADGQERPVKR